MPWKKSLSAINSILEAKALGMNQIGIGQKEEHASQVNNRRLQ